MDQTHASGRVSVVCATNFDRRKSVWEGTCFVKASTSTITTGALLKPATNL